MLRSTARIIMGVVVLDQLTKWAFHDADLVLLPGVLRLYGTRNTGAAFGMLSGQPWLLTVVGLVVAALLLYYLWRERPTGLFSVGLALVAAGALGNVVDRLLLGYVIDFVELLFVRFAVFNVADAAVTIGCVLCAIGLLTQGELRHE